MSWDTAAAANTQPLYDYGTGQGRMVNGYRFAQPNPDGSNSFWNGNRFEDYSTFQLPLPDNIGVADNGSQRDSNINGGVYQITNSAGQMGPQMPGDVSVNPALLKAPNSYGADMSAYNGTIPAPSTAPTVTPAGITLPGSPPVINPHPTGTPSPGSISSVNQNNGVVSGPQDPRITTAEQGVVNGFAGAGVLGGLGSAYAAPGVLAGTTPTAGVGATGGAVADATVPIGGAAAGMAGALPGAPVVAGVGGGAAGIAVGAGAGAGAGGAAGAGAGAGAGVVAGGAAAGAAGAGAGSLIGPILQGAGGLASGIGAVVAGQQTGQAVTDAANAQVSAQDKALAAQTKNYQDYLAELQRQFNTQQTNNKPWMDAGTNALAKLGTFDQDNPAFSFNTTGTNADPSYSFRLSEGLKALQNSAAARGQLLSGNTMKGITDYGQNAASQEYQNAFNRYQTTRGQKLNELQSLAGVGQSAVQQSNQASQNYTGAYGQASANQGANIGNAFSNAGNAQAQGITGAANANASGYIGAINAGNSALGNALSSMQSNALMSILMGRNNNAS